MDGWREIWGAREVAEGLRQEGDRGGRAEVRWRQVGEKNRLREMVNYGRNKGR